MIRERGSKSDEMYFPDHVGPWKEYPQGPAARSAIPSEGAAEAKPARRTVGIARRDEKCMMKEVVF